MKKLMIIMVLAVAGWLGKTSAQTPAVIWSDKAGWHKIGEKIVDLKMEEDEVLVLGADKFSALKFKVTDASIEILSAEVVFEDDEDFFGIKKDAAKEKEAMDMDKKGIYKDRDAMKKDKEGLYKDTYQGDVQNRQMIPINTPLTAGTETRVFELSGGSHELKSIKFRYKTLPNVKEERATIEIWGFKTAVKESEEEKPEM